MLRDDIKSFDKSQLKIKGGGGVSSHSRKIKPQDSNTISAIHAITEKLQVNIERGGGCLGYL